jgi:hypothetical protein
VFRRRIEISLVGRPEELGNRPKENPRGCRELSFDRCRHEHAFRKHRQRYTMGWNRDELLSDSIPSNISTTRQKDFAQAENDCWYFVSRFVTTF